MYVYPENSKIERSSQAVFDTCHSGTLLGNILLIKDPESYLIPFFFE